MLSANQIVITFVIYRFEMRRNFINSNDSMISKQAAKYIHGQSNVNEEK